MIFLQEGNNRTGQGARQDNPGLSGSHRLRALVARHIMESHQWAEHGHALAVFALHPTSPEVLENLFNHIRVYNECNDLHNTGTLWVYQGIDFVNFLYQSRPISLESLVSQFWFKDAKRVEFRLSRPDVAEVFKLEKEAFPDFKVGWVANFDSRALPIGCHDIF